MVFRKNSNANNHKQNLLINTGKKTELQITTTLDCERKLGQNVLTDIYLKTGQHICENSKEFNTQNSLPTSYSWLDYRI